MNSRVLEFDAIPDSVQHREGTAAENDDDAESPGDVAAPQRQEHPPRLVRLGTLQRI